MEDLTPARVEISGFSREILQAKGMIGVSLKVGYLAIQTIFFFVDAIPSYNVLLGNDWIHVNGCILSTLRQMLLLWNESKFEIIHANYKPFVKCTNHLEV